LDELEDLVISNDNTSEDELETSVVEESIPITTSSKPSTSRNRRIIPLWKHISGDGTARPMPEWLGQIVSSGVVKYSSS